jgi:hypothetical protein
MNPRIKELAKQAGLKQTKWADEETGREPVRIWQESLNNPGSLEKFAELIVNECANFIDLHEQVDCFGEAKDIVYGDDVMKHFGFE